MTAFFWISIQDKKIKEALRKEDAELFDEIGDEPSLFEMYMESFRGRNRWMAVVAVIYTISFTVLFILSAIKFLNAETTRDMLIWATACIICLVLVAMCKLWSWMEIQKNAVTREIKRLELQIVRLAGRIKE